jgi:hypothetical protein
MLVILSVNLAGSILLGLSVVSPVYRCWLTNEKTTFKVNDNELEQTNCQPKTEVDHANVSAKPIITHNHMYNEYPKHNRERHKDINLTEKTNRAIRVNTGTLFEDTAEPQPTSIYWRNY